jgi:hypothetical protein
VAFLRHRLPLRRHGASHKESKEFQLWTSLSTFLWTSTAQRGGHEQFLRTLQTPDVRLVWTVAEAGELFGISRAFAYELWPGASSR